MTDAKTQRRQRTRLLVSAALFAYMALLAVWIINTLRDAPLEPLGALTLGVILGAMTGVGFVMHRCWRFYTASPTEPMRSKRGAVSRDGA